MDGKRKIAIAFEPTFENVDMAREAIMGICREIGAESFAVDFGLAITEAMNNAVEHSGAEKVEVEFVADTSGVVFKLLTKGEKFDPTVNVSMPDMDDDSELPEGGYGLAIIKEIVDSVKYEYIDGKNVFTFEKSLDNK